MESGWCQGTWGIPLAALPWSLALALGTDSGTPTRLFLSVVAGALAWGLPAGIRGAVGSPGWLRHPTKWSALLGSRRGDWRAVCPGCGHEHRRRQEPREEEGCHCVWCGPDRGALTWSEDLASIPMPVRQAVRRAA